MPQTSSGGEIGARFALCCTSMSMNAKRKLIGEYVCIRGGGEW